MATEAQVAANRLNAQKSTGPKTAEGKAVVAQNALKHGLFTTLVVINGETQADYDLFRDEMLAELVPVGIIESVLAERIISLAWRLKRAEVMQRQVIDELIDRNAKSLTSAWGYSESDPLQSPDYLPLGRIATRDWANSRVIERLLMYERRIEHSLLKIMAELKRLQRLREKEQAPAPCPTEEERPNCEKQSQFPSSTGENAETAEAKDINISDCPTRAYNPNPPSPRSPRTQQPVKEDKPRQSQSKPIQGSARCKSPARPGRGDRLLGASAHDRPY